MTAIIRRTGGLVAAALLLTACTKDAQTEGKVTTQTATGDASTSISGDSADKRGQALVRVVNAVPSLKGMVVRADEMHAIPAVDYKSVTPYHTIDNNWVTFQVSGAPGGPYEPLESNREMLTDGHRYTMVVMRETGAGFKTRVIRDDISNDLTRAHLRVIHAAPGMGDINVMVKQGEKIFEGVNFTSEAGFKDMAPWSGTLEFRTQDDNRLLLSMPGVALELGKSYTIVLSSSAKGKMEAFWFEDTQVN